MSECTQGGKGLDGRSVCVCVCDIHYLYKNYANKNEKNSSNHNFINIDLMCSEKL